MLIKCNGIKTALPCSFCILLLFISSKLSFLYFYLCHLQLSLFPSTFPSIFELSLFLSLIFVILSPAFFLVFFSLSSLLLFSFFLLFFLSLFSGLIRVVPRPFLFLPPPSNKFITPLLTFPTLFELCSFKFICLSFSLVFHILSHPFKVFVSSLPPFPLSLHFFFAFIGSYSPLTFKGRLELQPTSQILCSPNLIKPKPHQALLTSKGLSTLAKKLLFRQISYHHQILQARMVCRDLTNFDRSGQIFKRTAETG